MSHEINMAGCTSREEFEIPRQMKLGLLSNENDKVMMEEQGKRVRMGIEFRQISQ